ncbi:MAG TPA: uracil-DNA glycosylase [Sphingomicrobium sp.]|nr:uracil-DNA glycosylase [Sphingomicrobium sp.]
MGGDNRIGSAEAVSALGWWLEAGVDVAVAEQPRNWLERKIEPPNVREPSARAVSQALETLHLFRDWLGTADSLPLGSVGTRRVLPQGHESAPVMLIAEMPGQEDAAEGRPIGGEAWLLMTRMLAAIGISAEDAYSASLSCFHAPGARMTAGELAECADIARQHIALARPRRVLLLGDAPARALLGKPLAAARGHVHKIEGVPAVATFHPRFLLNRPSDKALAWRDLLLLMEEEA